MAVVERAEREVVVLVGVPLGWGCRVSLWECGEVVRGLWVDSRHLRWGVWMGWRLRQVDEDGMEWLRHIVRVG